MSAAADVLGSESLDQKIATPFGGLATPPGTYKHNPISLKGKMQVVRTHFEWHTREEK